MNDQKKNLSITHQYSVDVPMNERGRFIPISDWNHLIKRINNISTTEKTIGPV